MLHINIKDLLDDAQCYDTVREMRWPEGRDCPFCHSKSVIRKGFADRSPCQRYECKDCEKRLDDLTGTIFSGRHQPLRVWILCLYFMGLNLSNSQIAQELELSTSDVQAMTEELRQGIVKKARCPAER